MNIRVLVLMALMLKAVSAAAHKGNENLARMRDKHESAFSVVKSSLKPVTSIAHSETKKEEYSSTAGKKQPVTIKCGDGVLTLGGKVIVEHFYLDNSYMLNASIPDENEFFRNIIDLSLGYAYGKEKFCHNAVEAHATIRSKGIWGKQASFADKESGPVGPASVSVASSSLGTHAHSTGKPLLWINQGWLKFSFDAARNHATHHPHTLKLGYFPYELGRGIALGSAYGLNKESFGLYSYAEDKGAPGILLSGPIFKDCLTYDLYYAKFEERNASFGDTINKGRRHIVGSSASPWRGVNKDDEVIAGRLKWKACEDTCIGTLNLEPYIFYNAASDQKRGIAPDSKIYWGSFGLGAEHTYGQFECGGEVAFNYGKQSIFNIDRNIACVKNVDGHLVEQFNYVTLGDGVTPASVTTQSQKDVLTNDINGATYTVGPNTYKNKSDRFRPAYANRLDGFMGVVDAAYNFCDLNLKCAIAGGYASGDKDPFTQEVDKAYHGFVGLHEIYSGKRVKSVVLLDRRNLRRPLSLTPGQTAKANVDITFSDLAYLGAGVTWTPKSYITGLSVNPNCLFFWKADRSQKLDKTTNPAKPMGSLTEEASNFMGTELNLISKCTLVTDLILHARFGVFLPGQYFQDIDGVPLAGSEDVFSSIASDPRNELTQADLDQFRIGSDRSLYMQIGLEYKF